MQQRATKVSANVALAKRKSQDIRALPSLLFSFVRERSNCKFLQKLYEIVITATDSILWIPALMLAKRSFWLAALRRVRSTEI
jgi:hypothetical protein